MKRELKVRLWVREPDEAWRLSSGWPIDSGMFVGVIDTGIDEYAEIGAIELFTGCKDKNGKEIYEGDIISYKDSEGHGGYEVVRWEEFKCDGYECAGYCTGWWEHGLVIGNIHENPELLEEKK